MDEASSRLRAPSRRMASTKPASTKPTGRAKSPRDTSQSEISTARWAGVGLVIAALFGAVVLAVVSPSGPRSSNQAVVPLLTPVPSAPADRRLPTEQPDIVAPTEGRTTGEWEIPVIVAVPEDPLPRRIISVTVLRNGVELVELERPEPGDVTIEGVRLVEGTNVITAALRGPGGLGPMSDPITVVLDRTAPTFAVTGPKDDRKTTDPSILVTGTSEPGASIDIKNATKGWQDPAVVGPSGSFEKSVPLVDGQNRIVIKATDQAGNVRRITRRVTREDGRPKVRLKAPKGVKARSLPTNIKVQVEVDDAGNQSIQGAEVVFALTIPGQSSETNEAQTNASGRATWRVAIPRGSAPKDIILVSVKVTAPNGQSREGLVQIPVS